MLLFFASFPSRRRWTRRTFSPPRTSTTCCPTSAGPACSGRPQVSRSLPLSQSLLALTKPTNSILVAVTGDPVMTAAFRLKDGSRKFPISVPSLSPVFQWTGCSQFLSSCFASTFRKRHFEFSPIKTIFKIKWVKNMLYQISLLFFLGSLPQNSLLSYKKTGMQHK